MGKEDIKKICDYIKTHEPVGTDFEIISAAVKAVGGDGVRAITKREILGEDAFMIEEEERRLFAGISDGPGAYHQFTSDDIQMIMDAIAYSKEHQGNKDNLLNNPELKTMMEDPTMNNVELDSKGDIYNR